MTEACQTFGSDAVTVCAFTRTAARELVSRNLPVDPSRIGTLHAICYRLLGHPKLTAEKSVIETWNNEHPRYPFGGATYAPANLDDPYLDLDAKGEGEGDHLLQEVNRRRGLMLPTEGWPDTLQEFFEAWQRFKDRMMLLDFTDLIANCITHQVRLDGTRALFLDEVQDFSPLELAVARMWGEECDVLYIAGDDDQCLYRFKGSTPDAFLSPALPPERIIVLDQSYRVPVAVHAVAERITAKIGTRQPKVYKPRNVPGVVDLLPMVTYRYPIHLRDPLVEWTRQGKSVAILGSCSYMLDPIKKELREWGIPFHNPYRRIRGDWNPLLSREGSMSASKRILAFLKVSRNKGWWTYADLWAWAAELDAKSIFAHGGKTAMRRMAEREEMAHLPVAEAHLDEWIADAHAPIASAKGDLDWYEERLLKASQRSMGYACRVAREHGPEALEQEPKIILGTIHSIKGGEASIVILYPDLSLRGYEEFTSEEQDRQDAVHRMMYVGVTRAKEELYVASPAHPFLYYPLEEFL